MRIFLLIMLAAISTTTLGVRADEKLPILKVGDEVYTNVTVTGVSETELFFTSPQGMGNAKLKNLEPTMQQHFHYNAKKADAVEKQRKIANGEYLFRVSTATNRPPDNPADLKAEMDEASARVAAIVNQPVKQTPETPGMHSGHWEYWFHPGATKPDFNTVDIRTTQETPFAKFTYVTLRPEPGHRIFWRRPRVQFDDQIFLYGPLPAKKETDGERRCWKSTGFYRIIGQDDGPAVGPPGHGSQMRHRAGLSGNFWRSQAKIIV